MCQDCAVKIKKPVKRVSRLHVNGYAIHEYSEQIATLIRELKENQQLALASNLADAMWPALKSFKLENALLVPIPSKSSSFAKRGFNPAEELAKRISRKAVKDLKVRVRVSSSLRIIKSVEDQAALSGEARRVNLNDSMSLVGFPKRFSAILIDDVVTTGATLREANRCFAEAGIEVQGFIAFAETPPQNIRKHHEKVL